MLHPIIKEDVEFVCSNPLDWNRLSKKTILITGATGFLPAYMVETLLHLNETRNLGCKIIALIRDPSKAKNRFSEYQYRSDLQFVQGDISEPQLWKERCEFIIHAASQASPRYYGVDPVGTMTANIMGTFHLLNQARSWGSEGFLFFSSGEVYGQLPPEKIPTKETEYGYTDINNSRSCYAESKRAAETLGISYAAQHGTPFKVVRPFHTYGPGMNLDDGRVFADFLRDAANGKNIQLRSDGTAVRAFCYLSDAVLGFFTVLLKGSEASAYNVGNPEGALSIGQLAELIASLRADQQLKVERIHQSSTGYLPSPISINCPNVDKLKSLGWHPTYSPREGFERTMRYFCE